MRELLAILSLAAASLLASGDASANVLARDQLGTPLAPDANSRLSIDTPGVLPGQPVWVVYEVVAVSASSSPEGEIVLDGSFEGIATPLSDSTVVLQAEAMEASASAGTIGQQLEAIAGPRTSDELRALFGNELYDAYQALNAGSGRILTGRTVKTLPALGSDQGRLLVSVERAGGIQPVLVSVTVGQGDIPAEYRAAPVSSSSAFRAGKLIGILLFFGLIAWFFLRRRNQ